MSSTVLARLAATVFLMIAIVVAIVELGRQGEEARSSEQAVSVTGSPMRNKLQRCQALGEAALEDQDCLDAWGEKRRRFLSTGPASNGSE